MFALLPLLALVARSVYALTEADLLTIAPSSATCASDNPECRTAAFVAPLLDAAFERWNVTTPRAMAAVLSVVSFESVEFKYKRNKNPNDMTKPGRPGQGTVNMQMTRFNQDYLKEFPELVALNLTATNDIMVAVTDDKYNFGSGAWYYTTQCDNYTKAFLEASLEAGYEWYLSACIGVQFTDDRRSYWGKAKAIYNIEPETTTVSFPAYTPPGSMETAAPDSTSTWDATTATITPHSASSWDGAIETAAPYTESTWDGATETAAPYSESTWDAATETNSW